MGLSIMLRIYFLQHWFNLSDPAACFEIGDIGSHSSSGGTSAGALYSARVNFSLLIGTKSPTPLPALFKRDNVFYRHWVNDCALTAAS